MLERQVTWVDFDGCDRAAHLGGQKKECVTHV
jgi:hypothetical protein